jgi:HD-GYP domain-containing protein (c-di-GMP phosphodiesterase class II)
MASDRAPNSADTPLLEALRPSIAMLSAAHGHRDPFTVKHQNRTAKLAAGIAVRLGLCPLRVEILRLASIVHDIGKIAVPADILGKPGDLSEHEFAIVKTHCAIGHDVLRHLQAPFPMAEIAFQHHERLDGSGYPRGLTGENILLEARILAVADVFDAMTSNRPYRPGLPADLVLGELHTMAGRLLDADVVEACRNCVLAGTSVAPGAADTLAADVG